MESIAFKALFNFAISQMPPKYGLVLRGEWGSGKSWIANKLMDALKELNDRPIYISMNGMKSIEQLSAAIYASIHPVLGGKKAKIAKTLFYTLLKNSIKIDLNDFAETKINLDLSSAFEEDPDLSKRYVFIFDDLERSNIPLEESLGYINRIVENPSSRVICICNEDEIDKNVMEKYSAIKEKTFGKTITAMPDTNEALSFFLHEISTTEISTQLEDLKESIVASFHDSKSNNLRVLRYSIIDWENFILAHDAKEYIEYLPDIANIFFPLCFEFKCGNLKRGDLNSYQVVRISGDKQKLESFKFLSRYSKLDFCSLLFENEFWEEYFLSGVPDRARLRKYLSEAGYIEQNKSPHWFRGQYYMSMNDSEYFEVISEIEAELFSNASPKIGEYTHCAAIYLSAIRIGALKRSSEYVIKRIINRIRRICKTIDWELTDRYSGHWEMGYGGFAYMGRDTPEFMQIADEIKCQRVVALKEFNSQKIKNSLKSIDENPDELIRIIGVRGDRFGEYWDVPIDKELTAKEIALYFKSHSHDECANLYSAIDSRYRFSNHTNHRDKKWLLECAKEMNRIAKGKSAFTAAKFAKVYANWFLRSAEKCNEEG